jgi:hypothetical protein
MYSFMSHIGNETPVMVEFEYCPGRPAVLYPNDLARPEEPPEVEDLTVFIVQDDITESLAEHVLDRLEKEAIEYINDLS